ncbi:MAG: MarC family protein [Nannocystaceae bacterium]|nr:MarC family protein [bacterium]
MQPLQDVFQGSSLLFVLLNPFIMAIYLLDLVRTMSMRNMTTVMARASAISGVVFAGFAIAGDRVFEDVLGVRFASFLVFGGLLFLAISLRSMLSGAQLMTEIRGEPPQIAAVVAMPFMIGPGTVSAAVMTGARYDTPLALASIAVALLGSSAGILGLKKLHDVVRKKNEALVERYVDILGRVTAVLVGTIAVDMIGRGVWMWVDAGGA